MSWLKRVIARLLGHTTKPLDNHVPPTQTVGRVNKARTQPSGSKRSAPTSTQPRKSATQKSSSKPKVAQSTKAVLSRKAEPKSALAESGQSGKPRKTLAPQTRPHAKQAPKRKP